ncbi:alpha/beta fold hydrolase [Yinghuangia aomiensis]
MNPLGALVRRRGMGVLGTLVKLLPKPEPAPPAAAWTADSRRSNATGRPPRSWTPTPRPSRRSRGSCAATRHSPRGSARSPARPPCWSARATRRCRRGVRQLADGIPGARLVVVDGAKHSPQTEQPQAWLAAVRDHFDRLEGRR